MQKKIIIKWISNCPRSFSRGLRVYRKEKKNRWRRRQLSFGCCCHRRRFFHFSIVLPGFLFVNVQLRLRGPVPVAILFLFIIIFFFASVACAAALLFCVPIGIAAALVSGLLLWNSRTELESLSKSSKNAPITLLIILGELRKGEGNSKWNRIRIRLSCRLGADLGCVFSPFFKDLLLTKKCQNNPNLIIVQGVSLGLIEKM